MSKPKAVLTAKTRNSSNVRKLQLAFGLAGAALTIAALIPLQPLDRWASGDKEASDFLFNLALMLAFPAAKVCDALGIPQGPAWLPIAVVLNTTLSAALGTVIGWGINQLRSPKT